jgi:excisionase family DNA binding protein
MVMVEERAYTVEEVAERLRASKTTVLRWLRSGDLRGYRLGGTKLGWRVGESDIAAFIAARRVRTIADSEREG